MFSEEKLDKAGDKLEYTPQKSVRHLVQETDISKLSAAKAIKLLKRRSYKTTVIQALQPCDAASMTNFCNQFVLSVHEGEEGPQVNFLS